MRAIAPCVITIFLAAPASMGAQAQPTRDTTTVAGTVREYYVYRAPGADTARPAPLVLFFHGGDGTALGAAARYGFTTAAAAGGAVVVYPEGVNRHWADGRDFYHDADDVAFIQTLVRRLTALRRIDPHRIYAVGHSNGAMFANTLACRSPGVFAAIGTVGGSLPSHDVARCHGASPLSVIAIHGTADPLAPYAGGGVGPLHDHGKITGAETSIAYWAAIDRCNTVPQRTPLEPLVTADVTRVIRLDFHSCAGERAVVLFAIQNAGHDWPGGIATLPESVVGRPSHQIDASRVIWDFFMAHPSP